MNRPISATRWVVSVSVAILAASAAAARTVSVTPNNSTGDDTAALQAALLQCRDAREQCLIRLGPGTFHSDVLLVKGFHGTIQGRGSNKTTIQPLAFRPLRVAPIALADEPTLAAPYPIFMHFADGSELTMSGVRLDFPASMQVMPWAFSGATGAAGNENALLAAVMVDGTSNGARLHLFDVSMVASTGSNSAYGSNIFNCVRFEGQLRFVNGSDQTRKLMGGSMAAFRNDLRGCGLGIAVRDAENIEVTAVHNILDVRSIGLWSTDLGKSRVTYVANSIASESTGIAVTRAFRPPANPSRYFIADNDVNMNENGTAIDGVGFDGIAVQDYAGFAPDYVPAMLDDIEIFGNDIQLNPFVYDGVFVLGDAGGNVRVRNNRIRGPALDAGIVIDQSVGSRVSRNRFDGLQPDVADIHLYSGSRAVRVFQPGANVLDEGIDNVVATGSNGGSP
jgi:hypothetical protein